MCRGNLLRERGNPRNFACVRSWILFMFAMFFSSKMSLGGDAPFVAGRVAPGSGRPAAFWTSLFRACVVAAPDIPGILRSLQACIVSLLLVASISAYCSSSLSVTRVILLSYL